MSSTKCSRCLAEFDLGQMPQSKPYRLGCKHKFCEGCFEEIISEMKDDYLWCPLCRSVLNLNSSEIVIFPQKFSKLLSISLYNTISIVFVIFTRIQIFCVRLSNFDFIWRYLVPLVLIGTFDIEIHKYHLFINHII